MLRKHENAVSLKAGIMAIAVHAALLVGMLVSFNWKAAHPVMIVTEVELWDKLPAPKTADAPKPDPIIEEKPEPKPEPKIEEKPKVEEPKVDIELENKKKELELKKQKELLDKAKQEEARKTLAQQLREEDLQEKAAEKKQREALKKAQQEFLNEEKGNDDKLASAANASLIGEYTDKIKAKIRGNVNKTLCGDGSPEIHIEISVLPTGQISGNPKITKSSENSACDEAVERATLASEPLPLPDDPALKAQFRNLKLKFKPNN